MQPEPDRLVRPLRIVRCPAVHVGAMVIDMIDRAIGSEDEPAAVRELECTWLEAAASETGHRHPSFPNVAVESAASRFRPHAGMAAREGPVPR